MAELFLRFNMIFKYLISGGTAALAHLALLYYFTDILGIWYLLSAVIAFILSFFVGFYLQKLWTFSDVKKDGTYRQLAGYLIVALINLVFNTALLYLLVDGLGIWYLLAQFIVSAILAVESWFVYKFFIFNKTMPGKNVLIVTGIYPPDYRGPATMLEALPKALNDNGYAVKVITYSDSPAQAGEKGIVYRVSRRQISPLMHLKYFLRLLILSGWADIFYATDVYSAGYFSYLVKKLTGKKYIIRFAGDSAWEKSAQAGWTSDGLDEFLRKTYGAKIEKLKVRRKKIMVEADALIAVSRYLGSVAEKIGVNRGKIKVIYNSVDFIVDSVSREQISGIREAYGSGVKIIVSAGKLNPWKGFGGLIESLPAVQRELENKVHLLILGDGEEMERLKNLARELKMEKYVHLLGAIKHEEIMRYFRAADLFVLNTNYEGMSHTLLEVMRANTPIVSTDIGGNLEVVESGKSGILVPYNNAAELSGAMIKILKNPELGKKFAQNASAKLPIFSWEAAVKKTIDLLRQTL